MIRLNKIEINNFLSFYGTHEFEYEQQGLHLIEGLNRDNSFLDSNIENGHSIGSGKTTFCQAPRWALFGTLNKDIPKDNVTNKKAKRDTSVVLEFSVGDSQYRVERYRNHRHHKNNIYFFELIGSEWHDKTRTDVREMQKVINDIVVVSEDTFQKSILLTRDDKQQFLEFTPSARGKIFENIIQLSKFKDYWWKIYHAQKAEETVNTTLSVDIRALESETTTYRTHLSEEEESLNEKEHELIQEIKEINEKISAISTVDISLIEQYAKLYEQYFDATNDTAATDKLDLLLDKIESAEKLIASLTKRSTSIETKLQNLKPIVCLNCGTVQNQDDLDATRAELEADLEDIRAELTDANAKLKKHADEQETVQKAADASKAKIVALQKQLKDLDLPKKLKSKIELDFVNDEGESLVDSIKQLQQTLVLKESARNAISWANVEKFRIKITENETKIEDLKKLKKVSDKRIAMMEFWMQTLDVKNENSIKQHVIQQVVPVFNNIAQQNLNQIYNGQLNLAFDQLLNDIILYNGEEYTYHELSTGEKVKVNLGVNLSIFDMSKINLNGCSVIFMDEIFSNVDAPTIKAVMKLIEEKYAKDSAIYLISHHPVVKEHFGDKPPIRIVKEDGCSRIENGKP